MSIASLIADLKRAYEQAHLDCAEGLLPPVPKSSPDSMADDLSLPLPAELREIYAIHGGQEYVGAGVTGLFGQHRLHPSEEVVSQHQMFCETCLESGQWDPKLIPFASWDAYDLCVHSETGQVWEFRPGRGLWCHRSSIAAVLREVLEAVDSGQEPMLREYRQVDK